MIAVKRLALVAVTAASLSIAGLALAAPPAPHSPHGETGHDGHGAPASGHGASAAGGHGGGHHGPAPINWTDTSNKKQPPYIALVVNFALLVFLYYKFGKKPVAEGLKKRREQIAKQIEEAARIKQEAEERAKKYQSQLARLDEEAASTAQTIKTTGASDRERVLREAEEKAARLERDADALLEAERRQAKRTLYEEAVEAAVKRAEDLLRSKLTQADHDRLAEEFLAQLAAGKGGGAQGRTGAGSAITAPMMKRGEP